jgi:hypothetical protein
MSYDVYAAYLKEHAVEPPEVLSALGKTPEEIKDMRTRQGLVLKGAVVFTDDVAIQVRDALAAMGYKNLTYEGTLVKILPEDRKYEDFVAEAIYWYLKQLNAL